MNPKYLPTTPYGRHARLFEEIGEVLQADSKWRRFGSFSRHPNGGPTNAEHMLAELHDLKHAIEAYIPDVEATIQLDSQAAADNDHAEITEAN
ncbi:hypothetical protein [Bradyrhizobium sp. SZCCHNRI3052]|uniref:hypothetical protein n=1 Tax=Bradyrhizobium sp. SZCCHNRI3052 TaxID=3057295 RepID=UPI002916F22F|nr:hypothetical protein [Bradyrhizobium sp. SZCCHNRI3052]